MVIAESEEAFRAFLGARSKSPETLLPEDLLSLGFAFFEQVRASDTLPSTVDEMGDALLFQWGTRAALPGHYDECFYFGLTRQFISQMDADDDAMFQLTCQLQYDPSADLQAIPTGNRWCEALSVLPEFKQFVFAHPALAAVRGKAPRKVEIYLSGV
jgi:hypothetical protein